MSSAPPSTVCVIIVNYNGGELVQSAIDHLKKQSHPPDEVIIVDNASADGSADRLDLNGLASARLIRLDENVGFAKANNIAAQQAKSDWLALLNPDALAQRDWTAKLLEATERHPDVCMFASTQLDAADPSILDGAGDCYFFLGIPWRGGFGRPAEELPEEGECFSPCGASALYRKDIFLEAGGFDDSYFCYCEDVDLGFRLRLLGHRCIFIPDAVVHHYGSAITGRYSDFTVHLGTRNRLRAYLTNMPLLPLILTLPGHVLANLYLYLRTIGKPHCRAMRRGLMDGVGMMPTILKRRKIVQKERRASTVSILKSLSWNPLRLHSRKAHVRVTGTPQQIPAA